MHLPQSCSHSSSYLVDSRHQNLYPQVRCVISSQVDADIVLKLLYALKLRCNPACTRGFLSRLRARVEFQKNRHFLNPVY